MQGYWYSAVCYCFINGTTLLTPVVVLAGVASQQASPASGVQRKGE